MLLCALAVVPIVFASQVTSLWAAVGLIGLAAAAHQGWSANLFTMSSDMFPRRAVGSVVGIGGMAGAMGGATLATLTGYILDRTGGNYMILFGIAASAYLVALHHHSAAGAQNGARRRPRPESELVLGRLRARLRLHRLHSRHFRWDGAPG